MRAGGRGQDPVVDNRHFPNRIDTLSGAEGHTCSYRPLLKGLRVLFITVDRYVQRGPLAGPWKVAVSARLGGRLGRWC